MGYNRILLTKRYKKLVVHVQCTHTSKKLLHVISIQSYTHNYKLYTNQTN